MGKTYRLKIEQTRVTFRIITLKLLQSKTGFKSRIRHLGNFARGCTRLGKSIYDARRGARGRCQRCVSFSYYDWHRESSGCIYTRHSSIYVVCL